ncbi:MAG: amidase [Alphaproteobacteria bacterium]|nr:amidase [Alphaproteobacteria bacterium]
MKTRDKLEACLARIADPAGEGVRAFTRVYAEHARAEADAIDRLRAAGVPLGPLAGRIVSIKDLFDVAGEPTTAGSVVLRDAPSARADAPVVERLRRAGAVIVGKTNMTEFAFSGLGLNPHYGTPGNPADRARIPGGSSSGAAVAVADGFCEIAIGSDTGGSVRIPSAFCGLVGFKPTARRVPLDGVVPLSPTLDSIGPLARTIDDCARADAVMSGEAHAPRPAPGRIALLEPGNLVFDDVDATVAAAYERARRALESGGARVARRPLPLLDDMVRATARGAFALAESAAWHRDLLARRGDGYDPLVRARIERGTTIAAMDYIALCEARRRLCAAIAAVFDEIDALVFPTVPTVAPRMEECATADGFTRCNLLALRNPTVANFFDLCAVTLPVHRAGELPVGLMLVGPHGGDQRLLALATALEPHLARARA